MSAKFEKYPLKTVGEVDYTISIRNNAKKKKKKKNLNRLSLKGHNSIKIQSNAIKSPHAHFHYVHKYARFQKDPLKTVGEVDYTNAIPYYAKHSLQ